MLDVFKVYATDENKEVNGVEMELAPGTKVLVARMNNPNYAKVLLNLHEKNKQWLESLPKEEADKQDVKLLCEAMADSILLGWKGLAYKGKPIKYSKENAAMLLEHRDFRRVIIEKASQMESYRVDEDKKASGN